MDHRIKIKESKKRDVARKLRKLSNMRLTVVSVITGALETVPKRLERGLEELEIGGRIETIQTSELLRSAKILRRVLENLAKDISKYWCEKLAKCQIIIIIIIVCEKIGIPSKSTKKQSKPGWEIRLETQI